MAPPARSSSSNPSESAWLTRQPKVITEYFTPTLYWRVPRASLSPQRQIATETPRQRVRSASSVSQTRDGLPALHQAWLAVVAPAAGGVKSVARDPSSDLRGAARSNSPASPRRGGMSHEGQATVSGNSCYGKRHPASLLSH